VAGIISSAIAATYLIIASLSGGGYALRKTALFLTLPLTCIWFSDEMGQYKGFMRNRYIDEPTPGCFIALGGWLILALPAITQLIIYLNK